MDSSTRDQFKERVRAIDWLAYEASCGNSPRPIPNLLIQIACSDTRAAVAAAEELWNLLSHQANTAPVDVPALPFLLQVLDGAADELATEILDILFCFAGSTAWYLRNPRHREPSWISELRGLMTVELPRFRQLSGHANEDVAGYAQLIVEQLETVRAEVAESDAPNIECCENRPSRIRKWIKSWLQ